MNHTQIPAPDTQFADGFLAGDTDEGIDFGETSADSANRSLFSTFHKEGEERKGYEGHNEVVLTARELGRTTAEPKHRLPFVLARRLLAFRLPLDQLRTAADAFVSAHYRQQATDLMRENFWEQLQDAWHKVRFADFADNSLEWAWNQAYVNPVSVKPGATTVYRLVASIAFHLSTRASQFYLIQPALAKLLTRKGFPTSHVTVGAAIRNLCRDGVLKCVDEKAYPTHRKNGKLVKGKGKEYVFTGKS